MLRSSNLEALLLTPRATNADKIRLPVPLESFGWALFGIINMSHCTTLVDDVMEKWKTKRQAVAHASPCMQHIMITRTGCRHTSYRGHQEYTYKRFHGHTDFSALWYTVEPLYSGHHWDPAGCPVWRARGVSNSEVVLHAVHVVGTANIVLIREVFLIRVSLIESFHCIGLGVV